MREDQVKIKNETVRINTPQLQHPMSAFATPEKRSGKYPISYIQFDGNHLIECTEEDTEALGVYFESVSSSTNYAATLRSTKRDREQELKLINDELLDYNLPFLMQELNATIS
ncbi:hypothetical protein HHI36_013135 [Cryptolaemus montrouzieri]|uniref:Uncharacterized protein n=1 Tax=Cryptolaemus montrouzieri TaxID=559131 RepID=A0ABD2NGI4_9CUCU